MSLLHQLLLKYIPPKSTLLDIGFGSGRDIDFLYTNGYDVWGLDPSVKFVENIKQRFLNFKKHFFKAGVPFDKKRIRLNKNFDAVISIAVWMHLKYV